MKIVSENEYRITYEVNSSLHVTLFKETKEVILIDPVTEDEFLLTGLKEVKEVKDLLEKMLLEDLLLIDTDAF